MIRILLACAGGMSTSLLMNKMSDAAKEQGIDIQISAVSEKAVGSLLGTFDVLLLGPQVRYVVREMEKILDGKVPFAVMDMRDYGTMNGSKILDQALKLVQNHDQS